MVDADRKARLLKVIEDVWDGEYWYYVNASGDVHRCAIHSLQRDRVEVGPDEWIDLDILQPTPELAFENFKGRVQAMVEIVEGRVKKAANPESPKRL